MVVLVKIMIIMITMTMRPFDREDEILADPSLETLLLGMMAVGGGGGDVR